jgi:hypothetical protein
MEIVSDSRQVHGSGLWRLPSGRSTMFNDCVGQPQEIRHGAVLLNGCRGNAQSCPFPLRVRRRRAISETVCRMEKIHGSTDQSDIRAFRRILASGPIRSFDSQSRSVRTLSTVHCEESIRSRTSPRVLPPLPKASHVGESLRDSHSQSLSSASILPSPFFRVHSSESILPSPFFRVHSSESCLPSPVFRVLSSASRRDAATCGTRRIEIDRRDSRSRKAATTATSSVARMDTLSVYLFVSVLAK